MVRRLGPPGRFALLEWVGQGEGTLSIAASTQTLIVADSSSPMGLLEVPRKPRPAAK